MCIQNHSLKKKKKIFCVASCVASHLNLQVLKFYKKIWRSQYKNQELLSSLETNLKFSHKITWKQMLNDQF